MNTQKMWDRVKRAIQNDADLVLIILDARDPLGTRPTRVEQFLQKWGKTNQYIFILNKVDAVPRENVDAWMDYFQTQGIPVLLFSGTKKWGVKKLIQQIFRYVPRKVGSRVLLVGYPNVGKSTIINVLLKGKKHVSTSAQAGHTRGLQLIKLEGIKDVYLIDSPGIVPFSESMSQKELALKGAMMPAKLDDPLEVVEEIFYQRTTPETLKRIYEVDFLPEDVHDFLQKLGEKRGRMSKGGLVNERQVCVEFIRDWQRGKIPFFSNPPIEA